MKRRVVEWQISTGTNELQLKACRIGAAVHGCFVEPGCQPPRVLENLEAGSSAEEIIEQFHGTREQVRAVLEFVARN
jgi:hypothetical protein